MFVLHLHTQLYLIPFYIWFYLFKLQLNYLKYCLKRLRYHVASKHPDWPDLIVLIPSADWIYHQKNLAHSVWTTYTCHAATTVFKIAVENFGHGVLQKECHNHLRKVWVGGLEKELLSYLTNLLRSSLYEIYPTLHVKTLSSALACAYNKCFSLSENYPKVFGELFIDWTMDKQPGYVLYHIEQVRISRQDTILEALLAIYMNQEVKIEFLDESLKMPGKRRDNILMQNLFLLLASPEMAAQSRFLCIFYFAICIPMRWLSVLWLASTATLDHC